MKTAKERESDFRRELAELLKKHHAEITVTDDGKGYGMQSGVCEITMDGIYNKDGETIEEYTDFRL